MKYRREAKLSLSDIRGINVLIWRNEVIVNYISDGVHRKLLALLTWR
jgi:hypothetical protein